MNVYCMRHGRTNYNDLGLCNDDPGRDVYLTETGIAQAQSAAHELRDAAFERIIVSPLPRTRQTAEIVNRHHALPIEVHADLADIRSGFESRPVPDYFAAISHDPLRARVNGGESLLDHKQRVLRFIDWLKAQPEKTLLVVAHEETMRVFVAYFEGGIADSQLRDIHVGNCEYRRYVLHR
ncbi:histidine phosphatase family protein [Nitrosomonas oligotropha]|uniref:Probable phosphoglycerate mutase n=1 Tax=Nitrosomonas oligotropha TaxID=42354 RepID=A0A1H8JPW9_9PROT|nr:histidine phosphatase family protein [Nitrosomonas oligotropha]SDW01600.1 probable phosphoglycerate mutase [Nitrosomonas oligotropha]SEN82709.1 probable phosphoglycerate mutase [Nitrosomonas oligotropha]